MAPYYIWRP